jgi:hypothetical protein
VLLLAALLLVSAGSPRPSLRIKDPTCITLVARQKVSVRADGRVEQRRVSAHSAQKNQESAEAIGGYYSGITEARKAGIGSAIS